jgi:dynein heavy chain
MPYKEWVLKNAGQIVLLVSQIFFTKRILRSFSKEDAVESLESCRKQMVESINSVASLVSQEMASYKHLSIEALLTMDVHSRDILSLLIEKKVETI